MDHIVSLAQIVTTSTQIKHASLSILCVKITQQLVHALPVILDMQLADQFVLFLNVKIQTARLILKVGFAFHVIAAFI
jgi:hypothetical protein